MIFTNPVRFPPYFNSAREGYLAISRYFCQTTVTINRVRPLELDSRPNHSDQWSQRNSFETLHHNFRGGNGGRSQRL